MAVISVTYNEPDSLSYISVELLFEKNKKVFNSGLFPKDWLDAVIYLFNKDIEEYIVYSSSVDHFFMDGAKFDSAYLYFNEKTKKYEFSYVKIPNSIEFFVVENTKPTWDEFKKFYN